MKIQSKQVARETHEDFGHSLSNGIEEHNVNEIPNGINGESVIETSNMSNKNVVDISNHTLSNGVGQASDPPITQVANSDLEEMIPNGSVDHINGSIPSNLNGIGNSSAVHSNLNGIGKSLEHEPGSKELDASTSLSSTERNIPIKFDDLPPVQSPPNGITHTALMEAIPNGNIHDHGLGGSTAEKITGGDGGNQTPLKMKKMDLV